MTEAHSRPPAAANELKPVVIIGGGLAGCSAALAHARSTTLDQRRPIILIEAKNRLGGRVGSYTDQTSGQTIDYCQHVGMNCCTELKRLIEWLDQKDQWQTQDELYFYGPGTKRQRLRGIDWLPAPLHLSAWLWNWPGLSWLDRLQIARGMLAIKRVPLTSEITELLDDFTALDWLKRHGQSANSLERFWSTIIVSALGEQLDRVGLLPVAKVFQDGFLRSRDAWHLLVPQRPLSELFGKQMLDALTSRGIDVRLGTKVQSITWHGAHAIQLQLSNGQTVEPDKVIIAIPWHAVSELIDECPDAAVQQVARGAGQLNSSPISGVHTWWNKAWLPTPHAVLVGSLCQWIFPHVDSSASTSPNQSEHYYQIVISASRSLPRGDTQAVRHMIENDLRAVFPEVASAELLRLRVVTDPLAVFSVTAGSLHWRPQAGSRNGNLVWAGDWTDTGWPATMEGAIRSGMMAVTGGTG